MMPPATTFNSPLEAGMRTVCVLVPAHPKAFDVQRLVAFDYLVVHSGDMGGPESLHPQLPNRSAELLVRRQIVERGLHLMLHRGLVERQVDASGIRYRAGELAATFLESLTVPYLRALRERGDWVAGNFGDMSDETLRHTMGRFFGRWIEESPGGAAQSRDRHGMTIPWLKLRHLYFTWNPEKPSAKLEFETGAQRHLRCGRTRAASRSWSRPSTSCLRGQRAAQATYPNASVTTASSSSGSRRPEMRPSRSPGPPRAGSFKVVRGGRTNSIVPEGAAPTVLGPAHSARKTTNVSRFLLDKVGLDSKKVRTNADNETRDLSFRDLSNLCLVTETDIQKKGSPIETGQVISRTVEYSVFKLLLTGVDDSALVAASRVATASQSRAGKLEVLDELIASCQQKITESGEDPQELASQLERLATSIAHEQEALRASEERYQTLLKRRNELRQKLENGTDRRPPKFDEFLARFDLLDKHYQSDLQRLESIREAGSLLAALPPQRCPLCGATPQEQHRDTSVDGNLETIVAAAEAESAKIVRLRRELAETVKQLGREAASFDRLLPRLAEEREKLDHEIQEFRPGLSERRHRRTTELVEERALRSRRPQALFTQIADLQARRTALERTPEGEATASQAATDLSSSTLDLFARQVEGLLKAWNFPESERVHFEEKDRDLVIQGKRRSSQGKGKRAITHAAFSIGLMDFCRAQNRQHPGFVVLDSPLLAYRAPEDPEDDLRGTDVQDKFYLYLAGVGERQVIIVENTTPPDDIAKRPATTFFSKNPHLGRYGFFPCRHLRGPRVETGDVAPDRQELPVDLRGLRVIQGGP